MGSLQPLEFDVVVRGPKTGRGRGRVVETRREQVEMIGVNRGPGFRDWGHQR